MSTQIILPTTADNMAGSIAAIDGDIWEMLVLAIFTPPLAASGPTNTSFLGKEPAAKSKDTLLPPSY